MKMTQTDENDVDFTGGQRGRFFRPGAALFAHLQINPSPRSRANFLFSRIFFTRTSSHFA